MPIKPSDVSKLNPFPPALRRDEFARIAESLSTMASLLEKTTASKDRLETRDLKLRKVNADLAREIAEHKRAEELFRLVVESVPNGLLMIDRHGTIVLANSQTEKMFGYDRQDLLGQPLEMLIPERYRGQHRGHGEGFLTVPKVRAMGDGNELNGMRKDGR